MIILRYYDVWITYRNRREITWEDGDLHSGDKISELGEYEQVAKITCTRKRLAIFYTKENKTVLVTLLL